MGKTVRLFVILCLSIIIACMTLWAALAIFYSNLAEETLRTNIAIGFAVGTAAAFLFIKKRTVNILAFCSA